MQDAGIKRVLFGKGVEGHKSRYFMRKTGDTVLFHHVQMARFGKILANLYKVDFFVFARRKRKNQQEKTQKHPAAMLKRRCCRGTKQIVNPQKAGESACAAYLNFRNGGWVVTPYASAYYEISLALE